MPPPFSLVFGPGNVFGDFRFILTLMNVLAGHLETLFDVTIQLPEKNPVDDTFIFRCLAKIARTAVRNPAFIGLHRTDLEKVFTFLDFLRNEGILQHVKLTTVPPYLEKNRKELALYFLRQASTPEEILYDELSYRWISVPLLQSISLFPKGPTGPRAKKKNRSIQLTKEFEDVTPGFLHNVILCEAEVKLPGGFQYILQETKGMQKFSVPNFVVSQPLTDFEWNLLVNETLQEEWKVLKEVKNRSFKEELKTFFRSFTLEAVLKEMVLPLIPDGNSNQLMPSFESFFRAAGRSWLPACTGEGSCPAPQKCHTQFFPFCYLPIHEALENILPRSVHQDKFQYLYYAPAFTVQGREADKEYLRDFVWYGDLSHATDSMSFLSGIEAKQRQTSESSRSARREWNRWQQVIPQPLIQMVVVFSPGDSGRQKADSEFVNRHLLLNELTPLEVQELTKDDQVVGLLLYQRQTLPDSDEAEHAPSKFSFQYSKTQKNVRFVTNAASVFLGMGWRKDPAVLQRYQEILATLMWKYLLRCERYWSLCMILKANEACVRDNSLAPFLARFNYYVSLSFEQAERKKRLSPVPLPAFLDSQMASRCGNFLWMMREIILDRNQVLWQSIKSMNWDLDAQIRQNRILPPAREFHREVEQSHQDLSVTFRQLIQRQEEAKLSEQDAENLNALRDRIQADLDQFGAARSRLEFERLQNTVASLLHSYQEKLQDLLFRNRPRRFEEKYPPPPPEFVSRPITPPIRSPSPPPPREPLNVLSEGPEARLPSPPRRPITPPIRSPSPPPPREPRSVLSEGPEARLSGFPDAFLRGQLQNSVSSLLETLPLSAFQRTLAQQGPDEARFLIRDLVASRQRSQLQQTANRLKQRFRFRNPTQPENFPADIAWYAVSQLTDLIPHFPPDLFGEIKRGDDMEFLETLAQKEATNILIQNMQTQQIAQMLHVDALGGVPKWMYVYYNPSSRGQKRFYVLLFDHGS